MINNNTTNPFDRYFANRSSSAAGNAADLYKKLKTRRDAINGKAPETEQAEKDSASSNANLSPEERRRKEVQEILDQINAQEPKATTADPAKNAQETTAAANNQAATEIDEYGFPAFLNDLPLFNQFKTDLVNAFKGLDSATAGSISAQYELNYSAVEMIANDAGGFDVKETNFSFKLDLNYVKAAAGKGKNASLADLFGTEKTNPSPTDFIDKMKDYFSPENTADRIVDFATSFFPNSAQFKSKGNTEEARGEFADIMRKAVQKGFDQAMGKLGKVPQNVQDGIDKTHDLTFKGIDDFVKHGMNRGKDGKGDEFFDILKAFSMSMETTYSQKTYTYTPGATNTSSSTAAPNTNTEDASKTPGVDTEA